MKIEILGTGCTTCNTVEAIVREAVAKSKIEVEVVKVSQTDWKSRKPELF